MLSRDQYFAGSLIVAVSVFVLSVVLSFSGAPDVSPAAPSLQAAPIVEALPGPQGVPDLSATRPQFMDVNKKLAALFPWFASLALIVVALVTIGVEFRGTSGRRELSDVSAGVLE